MQHSQSAIQLANGDYHTVQNHRSRLSMDHKSGVSGTNSIIEKEFSFANTQFDNYGTNPGQNQTNRNEENYHEKRDQSLPYQKNQQKIDNHKNLPRSRLIDGQMSARIHRSPAKQDSHLSKVYNSPKNDKIVSLSQNKIQFTSGQSKTAMRKVTSNRVQSAMNLDSSQNTNISNTSNVLSSHQVSGSNVIERSSGTKSSCRQVYVNLKNQTTQQALSGQNPHQQYPINNPQAQRSLNNKMFKTARDSAMSQIKKQPNESDTNKSHFNGSQQSYQDKTASMNRLSTKSPRPYLVQSALISPKASTYQNRQSHISMRNQGSQNKSQQISQESEKRVLNQSLVQNQPQLDENIIICGTSYQFNINTRNNQVESVEKENTMSEMKSFDNIRDSMMFSATQNQRMKEDETQSIYLKDKNGIVDMNISKIHNDCEESIFLKLEESTLNCHFHIGSNNASQANYLQNINGYNDEYSQMHQSNISINQSQGTCKQRRKRKERLAQDGTNNCVQTTQSDKEMTAELKFKQGGDFFQSDECGSGSENRAFTNFSSNNDGEIAEESPAENSLNITQEIPLPQQAPPKPEPISQNIEDRGEVTLIKKCSQNSTIKKGNIILDEAEINKPSQRDHSQSSLLKTPRLINKSKQFRQQNLSSQTKQQQPQIITQKSSFTSSPKGLSTIKNTTISIVNNNHSNNNMPLQLNSQLNTIKEKIVVKKERYAQEKMDETETYLKLEEQVREQIKKQQLEKQDSYVNITINRDSICSSASKSEQPKRIAPARQKTPVKQISLVTSPKQNRIQRNNIINMSLKQDSINLKAIRQLENLAATKIQKFVRRRNRKLIKPLREGKNMQVQTEIQKQSVNDAKNKMLYTWILMNMAAAINKQKQEKIHQLMLSSDTISISTFRSKSNNRRKNYRGENAQSLFMSEDNRSQEEYVRRLEQELYASLMNSIQNTNDNEVLRIHQYSKK